MSGQHYLALDIGAESGRAILGSLDHGKLRLKELHRFPNRPVKIMDHLRWNILSLYDEIIIGIKKAADAGYKTLKGIGLDTWGVDFGLIGKNDELLGNPYMYRDSMTDGMMERAFELLSKREIYEITGNQFLQLNTVFQLLSLKESRNPILDHAQNLLFMPDLFHFFLTGEKVSEYTISTTSQLMDSRSGKWSTELMEKLGLPYEIMSPIIQSGTVLGDLRPSLLNETGLTSASVIAPASHDTASAVAAVPACESDWGYISSGTWSLVGTEEPAPIISDASLTANFTNEGGAGNTIRFLSNCMGLWILQSCMKEWKAAGSDQDYPTILGLAGEARPFKALINPDDPVFLNPTSMCDAIVEFCRETGQETPGTKGEFVRMILESLAFRYRQIIDTANQLRGRNIRILHIVGGGSRNDLLNQFTANAAGIPVVAGPAEATAAGNIIMQAVAAGELSSVTEGRQIIAGSFSQLNYEPEKDNGWDEAYLKYLQICN